jgi:hypothetical protein
MKLREVARGTWDFANDNSLASVAAILNHKLELARFEMTSGSKRHMSAFELILITLGEVGEGRRTVACGLLQALCKPSPATYARTS